MQHIDSIYYGNIGRLRREIKQKACAKLLCVICTFYPCTRDIGLHACRYLCIGYHMSGEVKSVLSLEGRYYNCHERAQRARDNYGIVTRVIQLISPSQSCDNLFITYLCLYQASNKENTGTRSECVFH